MPDIEIKRGYEVLPDNNVRFGIIVINNSDSAISDVQVILDFTESLFQLEGSKIQKLGNIPPSVPITAKFILKPLGYVQKETISATIIFKDHQWKKHTIEMRPKEVQCVCPFLKEKSIKRSDFLTMSQSGFMEERGINFEGISVDKLVLSMGVYMGRRTAVSGANPYDGGTYEGHTMKDESTGTLWAYETKFPDGFEHVDVEKFFISLGHVFKCHQCSGFGQMLKVLRVDTSYHFDENKEIEYSGALPESLIMGNSGNVIFRHISEFKKQVIAEALDGFEPDEFNRLKIDMHSELKREVAEKVAGQLVNPNILNNLIDDYCNKLPNPVTANKRLQEEVLPVRMKCEVTDVPVKAVKYEYKGNDYSLIVYGNDGQVWVDGNQPAEFTWKVATVLVIVLGVLWFLTR